VARKKKAAPAADPEGQRRLLTTLPRRKERERVNVTPREEERYKFLRIAGNMGEKKETLKGGRTG